ncbi:hypothetical protein ACH5RR_034278 [Cinchona calisaya]|uniref:RNA helicase n=1 Tax=Cinchona calisaya TaxID=153742 RepID=A0ABD2YEZ7_9GENT
MDVDFNLSIRVQANQRAGRAGRARPGKCYRLYPSMVYRDDFLDVTIPEIQRSSLAGSVLYLKSLDLPDIDILKFDFLDPPSYESLEDALRQLHLIDAINEDGSITSFGQTMVELPLQPSLYRTPLEANKCGCLSQALTVAAILSAETTLLPGRRHLTGVHKLISLCSHRPCSKSSEKKRKQTPSNLPDGFGWGIAFNYFRYMRSGIELTTMWIGVRITICSTSRQELSTGLCFINSCPILNPAFVLLQVHSSSVLRIDEEEVLPNYVVYHELIATSRPYMCNVCAVEMPWVMPVTRKLEKLNVKKTQWWIP